MLDLMDFSTVSIFQKKVYEALLKIPKGKVTTYKILGDYIECQSAQAIGQALKRNPFAPHVPCHRIIKSNGKIGGYVGNVAGEKIDLKKSLLEDEGVLFDSDNTLLDQERLYKL